MNRKWITGILLGCLCVSSVSVSANDAKEAMTGEIYQEEQQELVTVIEQEQEQSASQVLSIEGKVTEIGQIEGGYEVTVGEDIDAVRFLVQASTPILDSSTLRFIQPEDIKVGMALTVVISQNEPMTMSIPPMCGHQEFIVVQSEGNYIETAYFNEELVNEARTLQLNIENTTVIQNSLGQRRVFSEEDVKNHDAVVIYTASTRSIPAITTPTYIVVIEPRQMASEIEDIEDIEDTEEVEGIEAQEIKIETSEPKISDRSIPSAIPIREVGENAGYKVVWEANTKTVILTKEETTLQIKVGNTPYIKNGITSEESYVTEFVEGKVYISEELAKQL